MRTKLLAGLFHALIIATSSSVVNAQEASSWPVRPIKVIVGIPAGQSTDILMRLLAQRLETSLGQAVVVDNRPGAAGAIAMRQLAASPPDGYTLSLAFSASLTAIPHVKKDPGYSVAQLAPITTVAATGQVLVVPAGQQRTLKDFVDDAKRQPGGLNYGSAGVGTMSHLAIEFLNNVAGLKMQHVLYQGGPQATVDLIGNRIQIYADSIPGAAPNIHSGKIRALAVTTAQRQPMLPDVPTVAESGYPDYSVLNWMGLVAPQGTPTPILDRVNKAVTQILSTPDFRVELEKRGFIVMGGTRQEFSSFIASENAKWEHVLRAANIEAE